MTKKLRKPNTSLTSKIALDKQVILLLEDLRQLIDQARSWVARQINTDLVMLNWRVGVRIRRDILQEHRGEYGQQIIEALAVKLSSEYGRAFERSGCRDPHRSRSISIWGSRTDDCVGRGIRILRDQCE